MTQPECDLCKAREAMKKIMAIIEEIPDFNIPYFDDAITDAYNSADETYGRLRHYGCGED